MFIAKKPVIFTGKPQLFPSLLVGIIFTVFILFYFDIINENVGDIIKRRQLNITVKKIEPSKRMEIDECILPEIDAWDAKIARYLNPLEDPLKECHSQLEKLTQLENGRLRLRRKLKNNETCRYRAIIATGESQMQLNNWTQLTKKAVNNLHDDFIEVQCQSTNGTITYATIHIQVRKKVDQNFHMENAHNPSVFFLVLDSTSMSSGIRALQQTQYVLQKFYNAQPFWYLNKVGLNSRPNAKALFVGQRLVPIEYDQLQLPAELTDDCHKILDKDKSLYELFKNANYATFAGDDWMTPFAWPNCIAFDGVPTTHYARPLILRTTSEGGGQSDSKLFDDFIYQRQCKEASSLVMEHLSRFVEAYQGIAKFSVTWLSGAFHDSINGLYHNDKLISEFFRDHRHQLENSFVFLMGDHGLRFGAQRKTPAGEFEDNNPMLLLALPKTLRNYSDNAQLLNNLRANSRRHISHFDIYTTIFDIMKVARLEAYRKLDVPHDFRLELGNMQGSRSLSLLRPIVTDRSCRTMEIARQFCLCRDQWTKVSTWSQSVISNLTQTIVDAMNSQIRSNGGRDFCAILTAKNRTVAKLGISRNVKDPNLFKVQITVAPSNGLFEVYVRKNSKKMNNWVMLSQVDRLNKYGNEGDCVLHLDASIRPLCYCQQVHHNNTSRNISRKL